MADLEKERGISAEILFDAIETSRADIEECRQKAFKLMDYPEFLDISSIYGSIYKKSFLIHKKI